jgi:hypothetical protein
LHLAGLEGSISAMKSMFAWEMYSKQKQLEEVVKRKFKLKLLLNCHFCGLPPFPASGSGKFPGRNSLYL